MTSSSSSPREDSDTRDMWSLALLRLRKTMSDGNYSTYIEGTTLTRSSETYWLHHPNAFAAPELQRFLGLISRAISDITGSTPVVAIATKPTHTPQPQAQAEPPIVTQCTYAEDAEPAHLQSIMAQLFAMHFAGAYRFSRDWPLELIQEAIDECQEAIENGAKVRNPSGLVRWIVVRNANAEGITSRAQPKAPRAIRPRKKSRPPIERLDTEKKLPATSKTARRAV